ncbi:MAG: UDP-N-acetylmuramate dehydrogenase [Candidatus Omnitrophica bacterium]|nr:UDP-N-acetylmuramate dehydrogenase [Candidatus Omnitrophota bacterium]
MDFAYFKELEIKILEHPRLSEFTTFKLGGPCPLLFECENSEQLEAVIYGLREEGKEFMVIGQGSNLIVSDDGVNVDVIRYMTERPEIVRVGNDVFVSGATLLDDLVLFCAKEGLEGMNYASGIPGTVAGAIVGNAGAFGKQMADSLVGVDLLTPLTVEKRQAEPKELGFSYRESSLKSSGEIVLSAQLSLLKSEKYKLLEEREEILKMRREKHPDYRAIPCAGSVFKNLEPSSSSERRQAAGWFLDQAGAKKFKVGGAAVFDKHANIIIKAKEDCLAKDVYDLMRKMISEVKVKFDIDLEPEVRLVGKFEEK